METADQDGRSDWPINDQAAVIDPRLGRLRCVATHDASLGVYAFWLGIVCYAIPEIVRGWFVVLQA